MSKIKLTPKQERFCNTYVEIGNASAAYREAYSCDGMKDKTINEKASKLLKKDKISTRVKELQEELKQKSDISKDRILDELSAILDAKITDYVQFDGMNIKFKPFDELTEKQVKAIESIKEGRFGIELKLHGKSWTIERICKMLGFDTPEKVEHSGLIKANIAIVPMKDVKQTFASSEDEVEK